MVNLLGPKTFLVTRCSHQLLGRANWSHCRVGGVGRRTVLGWVLLGPWLCACAGWPIATNLTLQASLTLQEIYDDNVYILDTPPEPGFVGPVGLPVSKPKHDSWVTTITPGLTVNWKPAAAFELAAAYAPELTWYHNAPSENHRVHRATLNLGGRSPDWIWEWRHQWLGIDGDHWGPVTLRPGDCRAVGGIPLRDRRDAVVYRSTWRTTFPVHRSFLRPVASVYIHDFRTEQLPNPQPTRYIYDNFIDRWEVASGLDLGLPVHEGGHFLLGYRYGHQHQGRLRSRPSPYSSDFHRFLIGYEGMPSSWLRVAVLAGPDLRDWDEPPAAFRQTEILYWVDATLSVQPSARDTVTLRATRFQQPAFTSQSVYEDVLYQASWQHQFNSRFAVTFGMTLYIGDWQAPVAREDWILAPALQARYRLHPHWELEGQYTHDTAVNRAPTQRAPYAEGREYNRNRMGVAVRYTF
ncbi:MAG: hypothetical protein RMN51_04225 [Verrucomicrobiota bacterium]|nr:hypothetical protein [Limisphaera sp.]MDW8381301.1 hypothetical protein [Verrucomicrobiota bacterium]